MNDKVYELEKQIEQMKIEIETLQKKVKREIYIGFGDDPIFLLSKEEYEKYRCSIPKIGAWWWLRTPGEDPDSAAFVYGDGSVYYRGNGVSIGCIAARPALRISNLKCDTELVYNSARTHFFALGATWKIIDDDLAIAEEPIMFSWFGEKSNDYATSEVRKKLLDWYKERVEW